MGDKALNRALGISAAIHLLVIAFIGHVSVRALSTPRHTPQRPRFIRVDLVDLPAKAAPKLTDAPRVSLPNPTSVRSSAVSAHAEHLSRQRAVTPTSGNIGSRTSQRVSEPVETAGGKLNIGSTSASGDIPGNWSGGKTPVGWVPDPKEGIGQGSGHSPGVGTPEPPRREGPPQTGNSSPSPTPNPPRPEFVDVRVCSHSGLLPGPNCRATEVRTFAEERKPGRTCDLCQPPHTSRLADRAEPQLLQDYPVNVPSSIPEGLTLRVEIQYTVTEDGDVVDITVAKSSGYRVLDNAIVRAASRMKYKPAVQNGIPRSVKRIRAYTINT